MQTSASKENVPATGNMDSPGREEFLDSLATSICDRGFGTCAMFLLESVKPLNFIGSQMLHVLTPLASVVVEPKKWEQFAETLEDRSTLENLIHRIEEREMGPSQKS